MTQLSLFVLLVTPFLAQDVPKADETGAESLYRDAWWQETGAGALDRALAGYLKAADADGTEEIRAKALYRAALIQQRQA